MADGGPTPSTSTALVPLGHVSDDITSDILAGMKRKLDQVHVINVLCAKSNRDE